MGSFMDNPYESVNGGAGKFGSTIKTGIQDFLGGRSKTNQSLLQHHLKIREHAIRTTLEGAETRKVIGAQSKADISLAETTGDQERTTAKAAGKIARKGVTHFVTSAAQLAAVAHPGSRATLTPERVDFTVKGPIKTTRPKPTPANPANPANPAKTPHQKGWETRRANAAAAARGQK
jgi:hypothetical protein